MSLPLPLYRIRGRGPYLVERIDSFCDTSDPEYDPEDTYTWSMKIVELGQTILKSSALAILKLHGAEVYHDWAQERAHWDMPLSVVK